MRISKTEKGFTLIELLIVIVILGTLAAVVALNASGFLGTGAEEMARTQLSTLQTALSSAMAINAVGAVLPGTVGENGDSMTPTDAESCKILNSSSIEGGEYLHAYIQPDIKGKWSWNDQGVVTYGQYSGGGKTCEYDGSNWTEVGE